jgi:protein phosphatase
LIGSSSSVGKQRSHNEDASLILTTRLRSEEKTIRFGLFIVADGMGGHKHGELASDLAIRMFSAHILHNIFTAGNEAFSPHTTEYKHRILEESVQMAHTEIQKVAPESGTTFTAALIIGDNLTIIHAGDSRAYFINQNQEIRLLTRDHSMVNKLIELGRISIEQAEVHPQRNVLYNALGQVETVQTDIFDYSLTYPVTLLLCSDGLWGVVSEAKIIKIIQNAPDPDTACVKLIEAANQNGGPDNITAVLVHMFA